MLQNLWTAKSVTRNWSRTTSSLSPRVEGKGAWQESRLWPCKAPRGLRFTASAIELPGFGRVIRRSNSPLLSLTDFQLPQSPLFRRILPFQVEQRERGKILGRDRGDRRPFPRRYYVHMGRRCWRRRERSCLSGGQDVPAALSQTR